MGSKKPRQFNLSFDDAVDRALTEQEILKRDLSRWKLWGPEFGYSAFKPKLLNQVLTTGTYGSGNILYCCILTFPPLVPEIGIYDNEELDLPHYIDLLSNNHLGTFAIYDRSKLDDQMHPKYSFKEPEKKLESLVAVVKVTW
jgi:hypothetical protein